LAGEDGESIPHIFEIVLKLVLEEARAGSPRGRICALKVWFCEAENWPR
jgi:hypothetical protein